MINILNKLYIVLIIISKNNKYNNWTVHNRVRATSSIWITHKSKYLTCARYNSPLSWFDYDLIMLNYLRILKFLMIIVLNLGFSQHIASTAAFQFLFSYEPYFLFFFSFLTNINKFILIFIEKNTCEWGSLFIPIGYQAHLRLQVRLLHSQIGLVELTKVWQNAATSLDLLWL